MKKIIITIFITLIITGCQSRTVSRFTGSALELSLPDDFDRPISFASGRKGEKDLFYWTKDGIMKVKTYTDWGIMESAIIFINN
tara:strand:+ start:373 stop:624 length:252 start_codon:yes stop_codon:yes gene_type:complete